MQLIRNSYFHYWHYVVQPCIAYLYWNRLSTIKLGHNMDTTWQRRLNRQIHVRWRYGLFVKLLWPLVILLSWFHVVGY